jgi:hypothetical protein
MSLVVPAGEPPVGDGSRGPRQGGRRRAPQAAASGAERRRGRQYDANVHRKLDGDPGLRVPPSVLARHAHFTDPTITS